MSTRKWLKLSTLEQCKLLSDNGYLVTINGEIFKYGVFKDDGDKVAKCI